MNMFSRRSFFFASSGGDAFGGYDVPNVEFGHHGQECIFDALVKKHGLTSDPALALLAKIDALYAYCQEMVRRGKPDGAFR